MGIDKLKQSLRNVHIIKGEKVNKRIWMVVLTVLLVPVLTVAGLSGIIWGDDDTAVAQSGCSKCTESVESMQDLSEGEESAKAVEIVLASDDFQLLERSIKEDGLRFDSTHNTAYLFAGGYQSDDDQTEIACECEKSLIYLTYFGFDLSPEESTVGIMAFVDVATGELLVIARVDQSSPDPAGLRDVTIVTPKGEASKLVVNKNLGLGGRFDWGCWWNCVAPPPVECIGICAPCLAWPNPFNPFCGACLACMGVQGIACAIACG